MKSEEDVVTVLANKDRLKDSKSPLVYINKDLSKSERGEARQLNFWNTQVGHGEEIKHWRMLL